jgi:hypothetical protein
LIWQLAGELVVAELHVVELSLVTAVEHLIQVTSEAVVLQEQHGQVVHEGDR